MLKVDPLEIRKTPTYVCTYVEGISVCLIDGYILHHADNKRRYHDIARYHCANKHLKTA